MSTLDDVARAARAVNSARESERRAAFSSWSSFQSFLKRKGFVKIANVLIDVIDEHGWPWLRDKLRAILSQI